MAAKASTLQNEKGTLTQKSPDDEFVFLFSVFTLHACSRQFRKPCAARGSQYPDPPGNKKALSEQNVTNKKALTSIVVLLDLGRDLTLPRDVDGLRLEGPALGAVAPGPVHGALQRVALPAKDVVAVLAEARVVARAEHKRLRPAVLRPLGPVVELRRVPDHLVHELRDPHRVGCRAGAAQGQEVGWARDGVCDVVAVVGEVEVLAVPAAVVRCGGSDVVRVSRGSFITLFRGDKNFSKSKPYVGKWMLVRIPPGQGLLGNISLSTRSSWHGAMISPPKFGPV